MTQDNEDFADLIAMTERHLLQEYSRKDWLLTDKGTYEYFKDYASKNRSAPSTKKVSKTLPPPINPRPRTIQKPPPLPTNKLPQEAPKAKPDSDPEQKKELLKASTIELYPLSSPNAADFADIRKILTEKIPSQKIVDLIPEDTKAKSVLNQWQKSEQNPVVIILSSDESTPQLTFLEKIATAVEIHFCPASVISVKDQNMEKLLNAPELKLVICTEKNAASLSDNNVPILRLQEIDEYLRHPRLKAGLWKELCDVKLDSSC